MESDRLLTEHDIPSPPGLPWIGNLLQIPTSRITQYLLETSRQFDGILALDFAGARLPFVFDPDLVQELSDPTRFHKTIGPPLSTLRRLAGDGLFTARGDEPNWGKAHRILLPAFSQRAMKGYFPMMLEVAEQLAAKWARGGPDADIAVADDMTRLTLDTISLAGFGYRFDSFSRDAMHPFLDAMVDVLAEVMRRLTRLPLQNRLMTSSLQRIDRDIAQMHPLVDEVIAARRAAGPDQAPTRDLLGLMLQARDPLTGEALDSENIRSQVITFLIAGHETTSGLLTFALYLLMRHPEVLARCYAEVDRVLPNAQTPRYEHLAQLEVIERVLRETLRLWPTAPSYALSANEDTTIGGRYTIRKGQRVIVFLPALHRHPRHWPRPDAFDIDRFLPAARAQFHPHAYKPFGNGERACIGQQFALTEAKLALAVILQRFALSDPHDYRLAIKETLTLKPDGFRLRVRPRMQPGAQISAQGVPPASAGPVVAPNPAIDAGAIAPPAADLRPPGLPDTPGSPGSPGTPDRPGTPPHTGAVPAHNAQASPVGPRHAAFRVLYGSSVGTCQEVAVQ
ncbi:MAG: cytochrome P450, partial [Burkholderiaceae bacterium]|nr:cytochrome P450 [Burkholderiaceae bacterium]